jgi:hypothetical protein
MSPWAHAQVVTPHAEGSRVEGKATFQTKSIFSTNPLVEVPLPLGSWRVVHTEIVKSSGGFGAFEGLELFLIQSEKNQLNGVISIRVYPNSRQTWQTPSGYCAGDLLQGPAEKSSALDCYSLKELPLLNQSAKIPNKIRGILSSDGIQYPSKAAFLEGWAPNLSGAIVYFRLGIPVSSVIVSRDFDWFKRYAEFLINTVMDRPTNQADVTALQSRSIASLQSALSVTNLAVTATNDAPRTVPPTGTELVQPTGAIPAATVSSVEQDAERARIAAENQRLQIEAEAARQKQRQAEETVARLQEQVRQQHLSAAKQPTQQQAQSRRVALVIGNDNYKLIPKLETAGEDARAVAEYLQQLGYRVTLRSNLSEREMKSTLRNFSAQVRGGDEVVLFFAGHGVQIGANNFLLPVDIAGESESQIRDDAIPLQRMLDDMNERKAGFTLAIVDACRDNPFKGTGRSIGGRGLASTTAASGQMVVFSAGAGQQALDRLGPTDKDRNGVFTRVFLRELKNRELSIDRVIRRVRTEVVELVKSVGHEQVPAIYDQVVGDYYFFK